MPLYSGSQYEPTREEYEMQEEQTAEWAATAELLNPPAIVAPTSIVRAAIGDVTEAIVEYTRIKDALDRALPDCIMTIQGRQFRKKNFWRAVATAFNLTVECTNESLDQPESGAWGYLVMYRATAPNGRFADGDGSCFASEKNEKQATVHNVRSHAHTRAYNRAVSNLVGFGEVSAEEMPYESAGRGAKSDSTSQGAKPSLVDRSMGHAPRPVVNLKAEVVDRVDRPKSNPTVKVNEGATVDVGPEIEKLPWINEVLGFGKHKELPWRFFAESTLESGRVQYLVWVSTKMEAKGEVMRKNMTRAATLLDLIEKREMARLKAAQDAAYDPAWDQAELETRRVEGKP